MFICANESLQVGDVGGVSRKSNINEVQTLSLSDLPKGWSLSTLGEVSTKPQYGWTTKANHESGDVKLLRTTDITSGQINWATVPYCTKEPDDLTKYLLEPGDIVISRAGSVGVSYLITDTDNSVFASYLIRFRPHEQFNKKYVYYYLKSPAYWKAIGKSTLGIAVPNVNATKLAKIKIPIAPINEQKRIVEEIEKQFSRLDEAVENLKRVKANLKRYKASVLKAAVEGKLTEEWRKKHPDVEPADKLLERILAERRKKWEETELAKMKKTGKEPKDDKWKKKYKEPVIPEIDNLSDIPAIWLWARLDSVADIKGGITKDSKRKIKNAKELPYLRVANVQRGYLDLDEIKYIKVSEDKLPELLLKKGDILFNEGGDRDKLGRGWIWEAQIDKCIYQNHVFRARLYLKEINGKLFSWFGNTFGQQYFMAKGKQTTNLASINKTMLSAFPIPLPPLDEQVVLIQEIEGRLSTIDAVKKEVDRNLIRAERLRQAILKQAFSGLLIKSKES
ncbi:MAG: restriction endonuclease subunit S [Deltaproteobacteria bacterium]|nr:restriction endonuclease subunit S [Deltaproteobacteria bacterium]